MNKNTPYVSSEWLNNQLNNSDLVILDASALPITKDHPTFNKREYIKHSRPFHLSQDFSDPLSSFPHTFPSALQFESNCQKLGINRSSIIVVYDNLGIYFSPRVWWMFKTMGHEHVYILDGGLPAWKAQHLETCEDLYKTTNVGNFSASFKESNLINFNAIQTNVSTQDYLLIDARSKERFDGNIAEPRLGLRQGKIPLSINIPYESVLENGKFKSPQQLDKIFNVLLEVEKPFIFSCGSGVTACIVLAAVLSVFPSKQCLLYDGSWTEYGTLTSE